MVYISLSITLILCGISTITVLYSPRKCLKHGQHFSIVIISITDIETNESTILPSLILLSFDVYQCIITYNIPIFADEWDIEEQKDDAGNEETENDRR